MERLRACIRERSELGSDDVAAMYALFDRYYEGGSAEVFAVDLAGKSHVIELRDEADVLCGFSTLAVFSVEHEGRRVRALFSGDTIIDQAHRGEQTLPRAFCRFAGALAASEPTPLYWLLISKGHRTYRYLHAFARHYFPAPGRATPTPQQALLDVFCRHRFDDHYDAASGLIRLDPTTATRLRSEWCDVRDGLRRSPDVAFFLARNPGFAGGDELACLCELTPHNLRSTALAEFRRGAETS
ncbi:MAG: hypothetical protein M3Z16_05565 [Pseudomonadota bacterium]|nr:hypothetical protein [Pseudomonadota bacterium]